MKKVLSFILVVVMIMVLTACQNSKTSYSFEEVKQMAEEQIPVISMMLGDDWDAENLEMSFLMVVNARYLYKIDNGEEMPTVDVPENDDREREYYKIDVLIPVITKYFPFSEQLLRESFENSSPNNSGLPYDKQYDAVILTDGWGWGLGAVVQDVTDNQDGTYDISYGMYTSDVLEIEGVVKAKIHPDGYLQFISNKQSHV